MLGLVFKMFLRGRGLFLSVLSIGFLVAILVGTGSVVNYVNLEGRVLGGLVSPGDLYVVVSRNSTSVSDSRVSVGLADELGNVGYVRYVLSQRILMANLSVGSGVYVVRVRGVSDVGVFLKVRGAYLNGSGARDLGEGDVGELFAKVFSLKLGDVVSLSVNNESVSVKIVGVFRSQSQSDAELVVPIGTVNKLVKNNDTVSFIEFGLKNNVDVKRAVDEIASMLPEDVKLVHVQQLKEFVEQMNVQVLSFLNVWSVVVYVVVAGASYIIVTRLITELKYELFMIRVLGAKKFYVFGFILVYMMFIAFLGSVIGVALGIVGVQVVSTVLRWIWPSVGISPFFDIDGFVQTLILTLFSAVLGCVYPAFKSMRIRYMEPHL